MQRAKRRRSWLIPAVVAVVLFVGALTSNLVTSGMDEFVDRYRVWLWVVTILAGVIAVAAAIRDAQRPDEANRPAHRIADEYVRLRNEYLLRIARRLQFLPLTPIDLRSASAETTEGERLRLADVYVALDTTAPRRAERAGRTKEPRADLRAPGGEERPLSALEAVAEQRRLVLVGEPGSGKSTFLSYVAYCLAADKLYPHDNWLGRLKGWPDEWASLLPLPITLRDVAAWFEATQCHQRKSGLFFAYLVEWLTEMGVVDFYEPLCDNLRAGKALLLLDGLDEVPTHDDVLYRVKEMIADLPAALPETPIVVTCRVLSYADARWHLDDDAWPSVELARLNTEQIDGFIDAWYNQLATMDVIKKVTPRSAKLKDAVRRPDLRRLAPNPLLLTVMALVHTYKGELPDARARLYEDVVELLLWRWESVKSTESEGVTSDLRQLLDAAGQRDVDLKQTLWQIAYDAQAQVRGDEEEDATADISKTVLLERLRTLHPEQSLDWAEQVVVVMQRRAGLLVERTPGVFAFPHRTFQEYLAGCHLTTLPAFTDRVLELTQQGAFWRIVVLLAVGRFNHLNGDTERPLVLIDELCPERSPSDDTGWRNVWLAGDCLLEIGLPTAKRRTLGAELVERTQKQLLALITTDRLQPRERAEAGSTLAAIGDPRDFEEMVSIAAGTFFMGSDDSDTRSYNNEKPRHRIDLGPFRIGRYPVTNGQYALFVDATGHRPPPLWNGPMPPDRLRNHPVVAVSWHDAVAYCAWLSDGRGEEVRLPSEAEWEKAARGMEGLIWPWGNQFDARFCNSTEGRIGGTTPVGIFREGASPYGVLDMAGNVWEWTSSLFKPYPYDAADGREDSKAGGTRSLRGGSWDNSVNFVRCAYRLDVNPAVRNDHFGFRVVSPGFRS